MLIVEYPPFRPFFDAIGKNPHVQTLAASLLPCPFPADAAQRHVVRLADGDRIVVHDDTPESWITGDRVAILLHGLCGSHASPHVVRAAARLRRHGIRTIRVDLRGCGLSRWLSVHHLYAGCSHDLRDVIDFVHQLTPLSKISLIGFSIGGAITLRALGEWGKSHPSFVDSAIAISPPIDLMYCSARLAHFGNRIYDRFFTSQLKQALQWRRRHISGLVDNGLTPLPDRLVHLDDQFTAPVWGFRGARDYYQRTSCGPLLNRVSLPTIILTSRDDPVIPFDMFDRYELSSQIELVPTRHGGHLGFLGFHRRDPDWHWMDWRICHWLSQWAD